MSDGWLRGPQWVSLDVQKEWEPILQRAAKTWEELEVMSITSGLRDSALVFLTADELPKATMDAGREGLEVSVLAHQNGNFRCAVHKAGMAQYWVNAWRSQDDEAIGGLLGFPPCCIEFFCRVWNERRKRDTTPWMVWPDKPGLCVEVQGPPGPNILLRRLGVRLVPWLPCSFTCTETQDRSRRYLEAGLVVGMESALDILKLLALPVAWSSLHGAALVEVGGLFRFFYETDYEPEELLFTRRNKPDDTPLALNGAPAAFVNIQRNQVRQERNREDHTCCSMTREECEAATPHHHDSATQPELRPDPGDNGFANEEAMHAAHDVVLQAVGEVAGAIDLGCGDGTLLAKIAGGREGRWLGVEQDEDRCRRGFLLYPQLHFQTGRIEDLPVPVAQQFGLDQPADVVLFMPGRLLEMKEEDAERVRFWLQRIAKKIIVYAYGDWLEKYGGSLFRLAKAAGFEKLGPMTSGKVDARAAWATFPEKK